MGFRLVEYFWLGSHIGHPCFFFIGSTGKPLKLISFRDISRPDCSHFPSCIKRASNKCSQYILSKRTSQTGWNLVCDVPFWGGLLYITGLGSFKWWVKPATVWMSRFFRGTWTSQTVPKDPQFLEVANLSSIYSRKPSATDGTRDRNIGETRGPNLRVPVSGENPQSPSRNTRIELAKKFAAKNGRV